MKNNHASTNPTIDYDAIMKSIKIDHTMPPTMTMHSSSKNNKRSLQKYADNISTFHPQSLSKQHTNNKMQNGNSSIKNFNYKSTQNLSYKACISNKDDLKGISDNTFSSRGNKNYVFSSIVYDDFSKQSCFQSVYRQPNNNNNQNSKIFESGISNRRPSSNPTQFKLYIADTANMQSSRQNYQITRNIKTPSKFKKWKVSTASQMHHHEPSYDGDKQNNRNAHNHNQSYSYKQVNTPHHIENDHNIYIQKEYRYLSHTQTSGNKIKVRKHSTERYKNKVTPVKTKKQTHKAGIELILNKCYQK